MTGGSLNRPAGRVALAIFALALAGLPAFGAGQASASHVSCGDTITADTTLDSDLLNCPNNGILIGADGITLNLNRHVIDGDGTEFGGCGKNEFCDVGVANDGRDDVTIKGGASGTSARACSYSQRDTTACAASPPSGTPSWASSLTGPPVAS